MTAAARRAEVLPNSLPPRGLSRTQAAAYLGISTTLFDAMVVDRRMPKPKRIMPYSRSGPNTACWPRRARRSAACR